MILEVVSNSRKVDEDGDVVLLQDFLLSDSRELKELRGLVGA